MEKPKGPPPLPPSNRAIPRMPPPPLPKRAVSDPPPAATAPSTMGSRALGSRDSASGRTATSQLLESASSAMKLRDEQLRARVQYFQKEQRTNAELDAITEQVVRDLQAMTGVEIDRRHVRSTQEIEIELTQSLRGHLEKLLGPKRSAFLQKKLEEVQRRISQLFFNSELYARLAEGAADGELPSADWPEQALYFALRRYEDFIQSEIDVTPVRDPLIRERAGEILQTFMRNLTSEFLSKTTPELERLLAIYREVLASFFRDVFPTDIGDFAWTVVRESRVAVDHDLGYKLTADKFEAFREAFDRNLIERLVLNVQEPIRERASQSPEAFRDATLRFVADPQIHSEVCSVINDALYDYLHGEGFLDLPPDWRRLLEG